MRSTFPRASSEFQSRGPDPRQVQADRGLLRGRVAPAFAARTLADLGYTDVVSLIGGLPTGGRTTAGPWKAPRSPTPEQRESLPAPSSPTRGGGGGTAEAPRLPKGAPPRGRRARITGGALPGRRRGGDDRDHRHGRGRRVQFATPDPPQHGPAGRAEGRLGQEDPLGAELSMSTSSPHDVRLGGRQHSRHHRRLRRDRGRDRQLPHPLSGERRLSAQADPRGPRIDLRLPLRGPGDSVRSLRRALLPVPHPRAPSGRTGPLVRPEAGVLGVLPGIIGSIQAVEAIKMLLKIGDPLVGRLLAYDALEESFRTFKVRRDPECPACGEDAVALIVIAEYDELYVPMPSPRPPAPTSVGWSAPGDGGSQ